jgi:hypothetical protein
MPFLYLIVTAIIWLRNPFSRKKYLTQLINKVILIYRSNPEIVIHDYYNYVLSFLSQNLENIEKAGLVFYECPGLRPLKFLCSPINIYLQIEHTLFRPGSETPSSAIQGELPVPGSNRKYLIRIAELDRLGSADIIFDYSRINLFNIHSSPSLKDYLQKSFCISPALYPIFTSANGRHGVITLFGNPDISRRKLFLKDLERQRVSSENIRGVYFGIDKIYRKTKIVINIRQTDEYETLEELRVLPALRSGAIVVCELAPYVEKTAYSKFIIWGSLQELPSLIAEVENNYDEIHQRIFGDGSESSSFVKRMRRIEKCNQLAMKRAIDHINAQH